MKIILNSSARGDAIEHRATRPLGQSSWHRIPGLGRCRAHRVGYGEIARFRYAGRARRCCVHFLCLILAIEGLTQALDNAGIRHDRRISHE